MRTASPKKPPSFPPVPCYLSGRVSAARPSELIVVTSDKALFSYVKTLGATVLRAHEWNTLERQTLAARAEREGAEKPEREDDVEGWLRKFEGSR